MSEQLTYEERMRRDEAQAQVTWLRRMAGCAIAESIGILTACLTLGPRANGLHIFFGVEGTLTAITSLIAAVVFCVIRFDA